MSKSQSFFDKAVREGALAPTVLADVLKSFERGSLRTAQRRLQHLRKETAFHLTPKNRDKLDRQLFNHLVQFMVAEE